MENLLKDTMSICYADIEEWGRLTTRTFAEILKKSGTTIKSVFVVGSMSSNDYVMQINNDFDIRIIVSQITEEVLSLTNEALDSCVNQLHKKYPQILFCSSYIVGPARHICKNGETSVLIHCLVMTEEELKNLPVMHRISYRKKYTLLYGVDVLKNTISLKLSLDGIINDNEGIKYCISHLSMHTIAYLSWAKTNSGECYMESFEEPFTTETAFEFSRYSVSKCTQNLIEYCIQEKLSDCIKELSEYEKKEAPHFDYEIFIGNTDYYIEKSKNYLEGLLLFANKLNKAYES